MDQRTAAQIIQDRSIGGLSYRSLVQKYHIPLATIHGIVMGKPKKQAKIPVVKKVEAGPLPDDIHLLKEELRKARLTIELQDLMLDISSKELGIDLRKKRGTRQSK
jgi:hypothetical protein